jgi:hypothetical protein
MKQIVCLARWPHFFPLVTLSCAAHVVTLPPAIPIVPVSFEANLVTAQQCEYRGVAASQEEARTEGANLLLAFTYADESTIQVTSSNTTQGPQGGAYWTASDMRGKAVSCPKETVDKILAMSRGGSVQ